MASQIFPWIFLLCFQIYITLANLSKSRDKMIPPLEFLNQMNGVQRGDNVEGVHALKKHLSYLGYLNYNSHLDDQKHGVRNIFDVSLESALKKYQEFHNINITGALDAYTITQMQKPRCGLPDLYNPNNNTLRLHVASHYSFFPGHPRWRKRNLKYAFNRNMKEETKPPLERALKEWASSTRFRFNRAADLGLADIRISFMRGYHGDGHPFLGREGGLAHTFAPPDGRVHFDAAQNWSSNGEENAYDIQTVGIHELGHALGLGHSRNKGAVMYPIVYKAEKKGLHQDDIDGIKALYKY